MNPRDYFAAGAIAAPGHRQGYTIVVDMGIERFLGMASAAFKPDPCRLGQLVAWAEAGTKWFDLPHLDLLDAGSGIAYVVGHDGRHRAYGLLALGYDTMPVALVFRQEHRPNPIPTRLRGQNGTIISFDQLILNPTT